MLVPRTEIRVIREGSAVLRHEVEPGEYVIGSGAGCAFSIVGESVAGEHARLTVSYTEWLIEDLGSPGGTTINGQRLGDGQTRVFPTQSIRIGDSTIELRRVAADAGESLPAPLAVVERELPAELHGRHHRIGTQIARGGMGAILSAEDAALRRDVAMKVMLDATDTGHVARFITEARITGALEHPNIVPVHELGSDEHGQPFYTMKRVRGETLKAVLARLTSGDAAAGRRYPLPALLTVFQKVCDAMAFAHSRGVIHRDLKPDNIMLGEYGEVLVMDWGLAKRMSDEGSVFDTEAAGPDPAGSGTLHGSVLGTPQFMPPEQARGEMMKLDARSDIYSVGAILYQALSLRPPVEGATAQEVLAKVARGEVAPLLAGKSAIPLSLAAVVRKAMSPVPSDRYASVIELQGDITAFQNGFATSAEHASAARQLAFFVCRHKATSLAAALLLLASGLFTLKVFAEARRAEHALAELRATAPSLREFAASEAAFQRLDSALAKLDAALALDPAHTPSLWRRAWLLTALERHGEAAEAVRKAALHDPQNNQRTRILPLLDAAAAGATWNPEQGRELFDFLVAEGATGEATALAAKISPSPEATVTLVRKRLDEWLGPGNGKVMVQFDRLVFVDLESGKYPVDSLEPLRGLHIHSLDASSTRIESLEPLRGMQLVSLNIGRTRVHDLSPLRGMKLRNLSTGDMPLDSIEPLRGMPLETLVLSNQKGLDLAPLGGMRLQVFFCANCNISDLSFLAGSPLRELHAPLNPFSDLAPLRRKPLAFANLTSTKIADLSPLEGMPLRELWLDYCTALTDLAPLNKLHQLERLTLHRVTASPEPLRAHPALKILNTATGTTVSGIPNGKPVAKFWEENDAPTK